MLSQKTLLVPFLAAWLYKEMEQQLQKLEK